MLLAVADPEAGPLVLSDWGLESPRPPPARAATKSTAARNGSPAPVEKARREVTGMGRDDHFLSRLFRFEDEHAAVALELYRRPEIILRAIEAKGLAIGGRRVAVAMDAATLGPRIIATDDGHFVTCLAAGMANGPWSTIDRASLDHARREHWQGELEGFARSEREQCAAVVAALEHSGGGLSSSGVERLRELARRSPAAIDAVIDRQSRRWRDGVEYFARRPDGFRSPIRIAIELWSAAWASAHLASVLGLCGERRTRWDFAPRALEAGDELAHFRQQKHREDRRARELSTVVEQARLGARALRLRGVG